MKTLLLSLFIPFVGTWIFWHQGLPGFASVAVYGFTKVWYLSCPLYFLIQTRKSGTPVPHFDRDSLIWGHATGLGVCALLFLGYAVLFQDAAFMQSVPEQIHSKLSNLGIAGPGRFAAMSVFVILINSSMEELYWRWFVHGGLRKHMAWPIAAVVSSAAFSLHHFIYLRSYFGSFSIALAGTVIVGLAGLLFAVLWERTGNILSAWICHAWADVGIMVVGYLMLRPLWG